MSDVLDEIKELKGRYGVTRDSELARLLGLGKATISSWKARGKVPSCYLDGRRAARAGGGSIQKPRGTTLDIAALADIVEAAVDANPAWRGAVGLVLCTYLGDRGKLLEAREFFERCVGIIDYNLKRGEP